MFKDLAKVFVFKNVKQVDDILSSYGISTKYDSGEYKPFDEVIRKVIDKINDN